MINPILVGKIWSVSENKNKIFFEIKCNQIILYPHMLIQVKQITGFRPLKLKIIKLMDINCDNSWSKILPDSFLQMVIKCEDDEF